MRPTLGQLESQQEVRCLARKLQSTMASWHRALCHHSSQELGIFRTRVCCSCVACFLCGLPGTEYGMGERMPVVVSTTIASCKKVLQSIPLSTRESCGTEVTGAYQYSVLVNTQLLPAPQLSQKGRQIVTQILMRRPCSKASCTPPPLRSLPLFPPFLPSVSLSVCLSVCLPACLPVCL